MNAQTRELIEQRKEQGRDLFNPAKMLALKRGTRYPKKHGAMMVYQDSKIEVRFDTYEPNLWVNVNGQGVLFFHSGHIKRFIPDTWVDHLLALAEPVLEEERQREIEREKERNAEDLANWGITE